MLLDENLIAFFKAASTVNAGALFLYDRFSKTFVLSEVRSETIRNILKDDGDLLHIIGQNNHFTIDDISASKCWGLASSSSSGKLSMNVCIDRSRMCFVNIQIVVVAHQHQQDNPKYLLCSLRFSSRKEEEISFIDRESKAIWQYNTYTKSFSKLDVEPLTYNELEVIRLSRMGYLEREMAEIMNKSLDSIRWYKRNVYEKLSVNNIQACIAHCELYHIL